MALLAFNDKGIYCDQGGFYVDPWRPVDRAIITHGHSDHARQGHKRYLCTPESAAVLKYRLGRDITIESLPFGQELNIKGVRIKLIPAGHIIGSAQVRIEYKGEVWVVTGDYKMENDGLSGEFEPIPCHHLITECTFGLPIYRWKPQQLIFDEINAWWSSNQAAGKVSLLAGYSLGKAQRLIQGVDASIGKIYTHGAIENTNEVLRAEGIPIRKTHYISPDIGFNELKGHLVIAPPGALATSWAQRLKDYSSGVASGWMAVRGNRRRRGVDRGFVLSDHLDWEGLNQVVEACNPEYIYATHGFKTSVAKWFSEQGRNAYTVDTLYNSESDQFEEAV